MFVVLLLWNLLGLAAICDRQSCRLQDNLRWQLADPICTFIFALLVLLTTRAILGDIWDILMERVPRKMDIDKMENDMLAVSLCQNYFLPFVTAKRQLHDSKW